MKKFILLIGTGVFLIVLALSPLSGRFYQLFQAKGQQSTYSQLRVESLGGEYNVFVDGELKGSVAEKQKREFPRVAAGMHKVRIERKSDVLDFFYVLERTLEFLPAAQVEVSWEAGPTLESSTGTIKYFSQIAKPVGVEVYVQPFPKSSLVEFDSKNIEGNTFDVSDTSTHTVRVSHGDSFEEYNSRINLTNESTNKVLTNLKLVIEVYLYKKPFV